MLHFGVVILAACQDVCYYGKLPRIMASKIRPGGSEYDWWSPRTRFLLYYWLCILLTIGISWIMPSLLAPFLRSSGGKGKDRIARQMRGNIRDLPKPRTVREQLAWYGLMFALFFVLLKELCIQAYLVHARAPSPLLVWMLGAAFTASSLFMVFKLNRKSLR